MIAKAPQGGKRGADTGGLLRYLFGPGKANEHTNPHLIAAWDPEWLAGGAFAEQIGERGWITTLARDIDAAMTGHDVQLEAGHVYHVALSLPAADGALDDSTWKTLVDDAVEQMGFGPKPDGSGGCRWVAVHHGKSADGNDHVHLLVNLVRGDGTVAGTYRDWPRWREWCLAVEERLDLTRTAPAGAGRKGTSRAELERAKTAGTTTEREQLAEIVANTAVTALNEMDFLARLRLRDVQVKPHVSGGKVVGYAVALAASAGGDKPSWFAGSTLRRDLSLPRLRSRWEDLGEKWDVYAIEWWSGNRRAELVEQHRSRLAWKSVTRHLQQAEAVLQNEPAADPVRWHQTVGELADLIVVLTRFDSADGNLREVGDQLTRAAQLERGQGHPGPRLREVAVPLLVAATQAAIACKDPAPLVLAGVLLLVLGIVRILQAVTEQHGQRLRSAARQQINVAAKNLGRHPSLAARIVGFEDYATSQRQEPTDRPDTGVQVGDLHMSRPASDQGASAAQRPGMRRQVVPPLRKYGRGR
ncbi:relaxase/mobilization nuclease domain-containing protein [Amycolatopsis sp. A1MSW2902]|uniref:relaxase/mobilization nuclease domain-containing protein n=1 Tax=Amycolatopsis sp. A1MSW2902 TaxID=687413 RepID=UPI00307F098C